MGSAELSVWQLIVKGGPIMWPILVCSLAAVTLTIDKLLQFSSINTDIAELKHNVFEALKDNKLKEALVICEQSASPVAKVIKAGIFNAGANRILMKEAIDDAVATEIPALEKRLSALSAIAHTSLMLGLLGTVVGMVEIFRTIEVRSVSMVPVTASDLSGGIWQALLTTMFGLCVAIPAYLTHSYLQSRADDYILKMEKAGRETASMLSYLVPTTASQGEPL